MNLQEYKEWKEGIHKSINEDDIKKLSSIPGEVGTHNIKKPSEIKQQTDAPKDKHQENRSNSAIDSNANAPQASFDGEQKQSNDGNQNNTSLKHKVLNAVETGKTNKPTPTLQDGLASTNKEENVRKNLNQGKDNSHNNMSALGNEFAQKMSDIKNVSMTDEIIKNNVKGTNPHSEKVEKIGNLDSFKKFIKDRHDKKEVSNVKDDKPISGNIEVDKKIQNKESNSENAGKIGAPSKTVDMRGTHGHGEINVSKEVQSGKDNVNNSGNINTDNVNKEPEKTEDKSNDAKEDTKTSKDKDTKDSTDNDKNNEEAKNSNAKRETLKDKLQRGAKKVLDKSINKTVDTAFKVKDVADHVKNRFASRVVANQRARGVNTQSVSQGSAQSASQAQAQTSNNVSNNTAKTQTQTKTQTNNTNGVGTSTGTINAGGASNRGGGSGSPIINISNNNNNSSNNSSSNSIAQHTKDANAFNQNELEKILKKLEQMKNGSNGDKENSKINTAIDKVKKVINNPASKDKNNDEGSEDSLSKLLKNLLDNKKTDIEKSTQEVKSTNNENSDKVEDKASDKVEDGKTEEVEDKNKSTKIPKNIKQPVNSLLHPDSVGAKSLKTDNVASSYNAEDHYSKDELDNLSAEEVKERKGYIELLKAKNPDIKLDNDLKTSVLKKMVEKHNVEQLPSGEAKGSKNEQKLRLKGQGSTKNYRHAKQKTNPLTITDPSQSDEVKNNDDGERTGNKTIVKKKNTKEVDVEEDNSRNDLKQQVESAKKHRKDEDEIKSQIEKDIPDTLDGLKELAEKHNINIGKKGYNAAIKYFVKERAKQIQGEGSTHHPSNSEVKEVDNSSSQEPSDTSVKETDEKKK